MHQKTSVAIVGCGSIADTHVRALSAIGVTPVLAVSRTLAGAQRFAAAHNIPAFSDDFDRALSDDIDCVHLCTPPTQHFAQAKAVLERGKHLVCEKPLTLHPAEAFELARLAAESGRVAAVCLNDRSYEAVQRMRARVQAGEAGRVLHVFGRYLQQFHLPPHADSWRFDPKLGGDMRAVTEIGTHLSDLAMYLGGSRIQSVCADFANFFPTRYRKDGMLYAEPAGASAPTETEDAAAVLVRFENGAMGTLMLSEVAAGYGNALSIEVCGAKATFAFDEERPDRLRVGAAHGGMSEEIGQPCVRDDTFVRLFTEVYRAIRIGSGNYPTLTDGAQTAAVCHAMAQSAKAHAWADVAYA